MPLFRYCPNCGQPLPPPTQPPDEVLLQRCPHCQSTHYRNAKPTAGAIIERDGRVLLGRRAVEPYHDWWDIPGGFLEPWEHPEDGVRREIREETGLEAQIERLLAVIVDRYGDTGDFTLNFYYLAQAPVGEPRAADDVAELRWFAAEALPEQVAFTSGPKALALWLAQRGAVR